MLYFMEVLLLNNSDNSSYYNEKEEQMFGNNINFVNVTETFQSLLKSLSLNEYPCKKIEEKKTIVRFPNGKKFIINDDDEYVNERESLLDLIKDKHSPWYIDYEWSNEAKTIRELYLSNSKKLNLKTVEENFKTLRLLDKNIKYVDKGLLKFSNLEELNLNVNWIESCDSSNLPLSLTSLDLSGNQLHDMSSLMNKCLVNLQHLGIGYNHIYDLKDYLQPTHWPSLASLDLSANHFTDLKDIVLNKLKKLTKLKSLVLYGNPISLIPSYKGFIIDSLIGLNYLDDQAISRDERFSFYNFRLYPDLIKNEAEVIISVNSLKNVYMPYELRYPENFEDFPVYMYKYFIRFTYIEDKDYDNSTIDENYGNDDNKQNKDHVKVHVHDMSIHFDDDEVIYKNYRGLMKDRFTVKKSYRNKIITTQTCDYNENIQFNDKGVLKIKHSALKALRDFMIHGLQIEVIEQKSTYDEPEEKDETTKSPSSKKDKQSGKKDNKKDKKGESGKKDKKDAKKTIDPKKRKDMNAFVAELELINNEENVLGSFHLPLDPIIDCTTYKIEQTFTKQLEIPQYVQDEFNNGGEANPASGKGKGKEKKNSAGAKGKPGKPDAGKDKNSKSKASSKNATPGVEGEEVLLPNVLELNMKFELVNFTSFDQFKSHFNINDNETNVALLQPPKSIK